MEIAQDIARRLIESHLEHGDPLPPAVRKAIKTANGELPFRIIRAAASKTQRA